MPLNVIPTALPGVVIIEPDVFRDARGFFMETYNLQKYTEHDLVKTFVQDNLSHSSRGTLRGLHYQLEHPQGKFIFVVRGEIFDVAVDIRRGSPTFGHWIGETLSDRNSRQFFIPEGFAHGFCVLSETADVMYKCTDFYHPEDDRGIRWNDTSIQIRWPLSNPLLSEKDSRLPGLDDIPPEHLPLYPP